METELSKLRAKHTIEWRRSVLVQYKLMLWLASTRKKNKDMKMNGMLGLQIIK